MVFQSCRTVNKIRVFQMFDCDDEVSILGLQSKGTFHHILLHQ